MATCLTRINQHYGSQLRLPLIRYNQRGKIAGSARLQLNEVRLNPTLLLQNQQEFLHQVIPHEVCHLAVYQLYGRVRPHGPEWQQMMRQVFKLAPHVTHKMDVTDVAGKTFSYQCGCKQHQLSIRRHNKVLKGTRYLCRGCGQSLVAC